MPLELPADIPRTIFRTLDGRMTTEAQAAFEAAKSIVANGRNLNDAVLLTRAVRVLVLYGHYTQWPRPVVFPAIGMLQGCFDRQLYRGRGIRAQLAGFLFRLVHARLEAEALKKYGANSPGWNDFHMAYWFMTADRATVCELHRRATLTLVPGDGREMRAVKATAVYLVQNVRAQYPDFDEALGRVETRCKQPVIAGDLAEGPAPGGAA